MIIVSDRNKAAVFHELQYLGLCLFSLTTIVLGNISLFDTISRILPSEGWFH